MNGYKLWLKLIGCNFFSFKSFRMGKIVESHLVVEDLPEAMLHSVREHQMSTVLRNNLTSSASSVLHVRGSMDGSLLASLQLTSRQDRYSTTFVYDVWFKGALILCLVVILLTMAARLFMWRRNCKKVRYRVIPQIDDRQPPPQMLGRSRSENLSWVTNFFGVSLPLLREVSEV